jgi:outer membrane protein assembly factor BamA
VLLTVLITAAPVSAVEGTIRITTTGNLFFSTQYLLQSDSTVTDSRGVERVIACIIDTYTNAGFPFCRVFPSVGDGQTRTTVVLSIEEGERVIVRDYLFAGTGKTHTNSVRKIAQVKPGDYFSSNDIVHTKENILKTDAFTSVGETIVRQNNQYYVVLHLIEKNSDFLQASGSFDDENALFNFSFYSLNVLGTLRRFQFRYEYEKLFSLQCTEPILLYPAVLDADFSLWTYDSIRLTQFHATFSAPLWHLFTFSMLSGVESVTRLNDDPASRGHTDNIIGVGFGLDFESPILKCHHRLGYDYLFRTYDRWRIQIDLENTMYRFEAGIHYVRAQTDSLEFFDYYRLGGARSLRGYREDQFFATRALWVNCAYKAIFIFPVVDIAVINSTFLYSYGFGMHAESQLADVSLVLAWPKGGSWQDGKIHLLIEKGF